MVRTRKKIGDTSKNGSHLDKIGSQSGKWVILKKNWVAVRKMGHTYKIGSHLVK